MDRSFYLDLATRDLRFPIGADMVLHEREDPEACRLNGECLGQAILEAAQRFRMPLAFPLMDLRIEKEWMLTALGIPPSEMDKFHFDDAISDRQREILERVTETPETPRMRASAEALSYVRDHGGDIIPVGMSIGPFSLMTKFLSDPITAVYQVGLDPEDEDAEKVTGLLEIATKVILSWIDLQVRAGAKAVCVCEPAYNTVYLSPKQLDENPELAHELVLKHNLALKRNLEANGADMILHDCGELNETMLRSFNTLDPPLLSLGSPCDLPEVVPFLKKDIVVMGNLPSKKFYTDSEMTEAQVTLTSQELLNQMRATGHPFILGTECDVLCVTGCEEKIMRKVMALVNV
ncbi:MAG: uroporphyrinogen decarboxylase family protein [Opitutales bacterium]